VSFSHSGTASKTDHIPERPCSDWTKVEPAVIDGTGLTVSGTQGLITISGDLSYIIVKGFEIRHLVSASEDAVPCGV